MAWKLVTALVAVLRLVPAADEVVSSPPVTTPATVCPMLVEAVRLTALAPALTAPLRMSCAARIIDRDRPAGRGVADARHRQRDGRVLQVDGSDTAIGGVETGDGVGSATEIGSCGGRGGEQAAGDDAGRRLPDAGRGGQVDGIGAGVDGAAEAECAARIIDRDRPASRGVADARHHQCGGRVLQVDGSDTAIGGVETGDGVGGGAEIGSCGGRGGEQAARDDAGRRLPDAGRGSQVDGVGAGVDGAAEAECAARIIDRDRPASRGVADARHHQRGGRVLQVDGSDTAIGCVETGDGVGGGAEIGSCGGRGGEQAARDDAGRRLPDAGRGGQVDGVGAGVDGAAEAECAARIIDRDRVRRPWCR